MFCKISIYCILLFSLTLVTSCQQKDTNEIIKSTSKNVIDAILAKNNSKFISLIGLDNLYDIGKTEEMINSDLIYYYTLFKESNCAYPEIIITETYNEMRQKRVIVPLCNLENKKMGKDVHLDLLFGPPDLFSLEKISGYELVINNSDSAEYKPIQRWNK